VDTEVRKIIKSSLRESGVIIDSEKIIDDLEHNLIENNCIIYQSKLPKLTEQPIIFIDGTPDSRYPIRILQAYIRNAEVKWEGDDSSELLQQMNEMNDKRRGILINAIKTLRRNNNHADRDS